MRFVPRKRDKTPIPSLSGSVSTTVASFRPVVVSPATTHLPEGILCTRTKHRMTFRNRPGSAGVIVIVVACLLVSSVITFVTGSYTHWAPVLAGLVVGLWAVRSISK